MSQSQDWKLLLIVIISPFCFCFNNQSSSLISHDILKQKVLPRQKRFIIPQFSGWILNIRFTIIEPLQTPFGTNYAQITAYLPFDFKLDSLLQSNRRTIHDRFDERMSALKLFESSIKKVGRVRDSHSCMLRTICEVALTPDNNDGVFGQFFNLLLTPQDDFDQILNDRSSSTDYDEESFHNDYLRAQYDGHYLQDCAYYEDLCPTAIFGYEDYNMNDNDVGVHDSSVNGLYKDWNLPRYTNG